MNFSPTGPTLLYQTMESIWCDFLSEFPPKKSWWNCLAPVKGGPSWKCRYPSHPSLVNLFRSQGLVLVSSQVFPPRKLEFLVAIWYIKKGDQKVDHNHLSPVFFKLRPVSKHKKSNSGIQTIRIIYLIHLAGTGEFPCSENSSSSANQSVRTTKKI